MPSQHNRVVQLFSVASLLLALVFSLPGSPFGLGERVDQWGLELWHRLFQAEPSKADPHLQLVELPAALANEPRPAWETTAEFNRLLSSLTRHGAAAIGITAQLATTLPLEQSIIALIPPELRKRAATAAYRDTQQALETANVAWLHPPAWLGHQPPAVERAARWPPFYNIHDRLLRRMLPKSAQVPPAGASLLSPANESLLHYRDERLLASFELTLLCLANAAATLRWQIPDRLVIGEAGRPLSLFGSIRPWPQQEALASLQERAIDGRRLTGAVVNDATARRVQQKIVLLGNAEDRHWRRASTRLNALMTAQYSHSPWWQALPLSLLTLLIWLGSTYAINRFSGLPLVLGTLLLGLLIAAVSQLVQQRWNLWLATGDSIVYGLCLGAALLFQWLWREWQIDLKLEADDARLQLADLLLQRDDPAAAIVPLQRSAMSSATTDLLIKTAATFERQGNTAAALHAYRRVLRYFPHHQVAARALQDLAAQVDGGAPQRSWRAASNDAATPSQLGRYQLLDRLGQGATGEVFLAVDPRIRRQVAIKTLSFNTIGPSSEDVRERFFREAETAGQLDHPNIVSIYDVGEEGDLAYIAMDYVPGGTLADWTQPECLLDLATLYRLMEQVAWALDYAHQRNIVHRDIKPGNLLFNPDDLTIKVTDFGIAQLADYSRTRTGTILGSPYYMSPEQVSGQKVGPASDQFSLGVTFYQLASGSLPFEAESLAQLAWQITNEAHESIGRRRKGLPRSCGRIINQTLAKDPSQRFSDAADLSSAFHKGARSVHNASRKAG